MAFEDVTILLQGMLHDDINLHEILNVYANLCNVVISVYKKDIDKVNEVSKEFENVTIIENDQSEYEKTPLIVDQDFKNCEVRVLQSGFFQICTTKKGLDIINTKYVKTN
jgi:hypothetical protein